MGQSLFLDCRLNHLSALCWLASSRTAIYLLTFFKGVLFVAIGRSGGTKPKLSYWLKSVTIREDGCLTKERS